MRVRQRQLKTPIGNLPNVDGLDFSGLGLSNDQIAELLRVEVDGWLEEIPLIEDYYASYGNHVPEELHKELRELKTRLEDAKQAAA